MTTLNMQEPSPNGVIQIRFLKDDGGWHRTTLIPGQDIDAQFVVVNAHLAKLGQSPVSPSDILAIKQNAEALWTPEVVAAYQAMQAANQL